MTFREYVIKRSRILRGTAAASEFIAWAISRDDILSCMTLSQIEGILRREAAPDRLVQGARSTWRSYRNRVWRLEAAHRAPPMKAMVIERQRETVGLAVKTVGGFRFFAIRKDFAHLEGRQFRRLASLYDAINGRDATMPARRTG